MFSRGIFDASQWGRSARSLCGISCASKGATRKQSQPGVFRRQSLAASRRRARKQLRTPVPNHSPGFKRRSPVLHLHQNHQTSRHGHRCRGVHHNTQRAMVGVRFNLVEVRNLNHRQQRQQHQAHHRNHRQSPWLRAVVPAEMSLESGQHTTSTFKNTQVWTHKTVRKIPSPPIPATKQ